MALEHRLREFDGMFRAIQSIVADSGSRLVIHTLGETIIPDDWVDRFESAEDVALEITGTSIDEWIDCDDIGADVADAEDDALETIACGDQEIAERIKAALVENFADQMTALVDILENVVSGDLHSTFFRGIPAEVH